MPKTSYYMINGLTLYRLMIAPVLLFWILTGEYNLFKWMLPLSFFTDLVDGFLARKYRVTSTWGAVLDSIADDATILTGITGLFFFKYEFVMQQKVIIFTLLTLFAIQTLMSLIRYKRVSSFHTYLAKTAAILQGLFLIITFLFSSPLYVLFYMVTCITALELIEEMILVMVLPVWEIDVKGLYWVLTRKRTTKR